MSSYLNIQTIGIATGIGFFAYCIYFDYKRRNAPDYQQKVRERRERERLAREKENEIELPPLNDKAAVEAFFIREIEAGEELLQSGDTDNAVKHMSYAVATCSQAESFLRYLKEALPTTAYSKLLEELVKVKEKVKQAQEAANKEGPEIEPVD